MNLVIECVVGECFHANNMFQSAGTHKEKDFNAELRADADHQTGGYRSPSTVLQDHDCIPMRVLARQKTQRPI